MSRFKGNTKRWIPKKWDPLYDQMVALSCAGVSNKEIARRFNYGAQQVSNILCSPQAEVVRELVRRHVHKEAEGDISKRLENITQHAVGNIEAVITNKDLLDSKPFAMFDRSTKILEGLNRLKPDGERNINILNISAEASANLVAGLQSANEAAKLHGGTKLIGNVEVNEIKNSL